MIKQIFIFISVGLVGLGLYLNFFYDAPDSQATANFFTSWFLVIVGIAGLLINLLWKKSSQ
jgi:hypothetical protein